MLQLNQKETAIAIANPDRENFELELKTPRHVRARRTTDALRFRNREAVPGLWSGRAELLAGLNAPQAWISSKYFYDSLGSQLFEAITHLPEYYPTRTEAAIFSHHIGDIAHAVGTGPNLIDLGAGNCEKAASLFAALKPAQYIAVDISADYLESALTRLRHQFPDIGMTGLGMDMSEGLSLPDSIPGARRLFFYPGSSIGNFTPADAAGFLSDLRRQCQQQSGLLIGVDLIKDKAILDAAYDDALGVTAAFNLNVLRQLNRLIGSDFRPEDWRHIGRYVEAESRIEMHLEARRALTVHWPGAQRAFRAGERIHTENSCKYTRDGFKALLEQAGFARPACWTDERGWFAVYWAAAR